MEAENDVRTRVGENAIGDHRGRASGALFGRLEGEDDPSPFRRVPKEEIGGHVERRDVAVVPAGVHLPVGRGEREAGPLRDGERVELGAEEHRPPRTPRVQKGRERRSYRGRSSR